MRSSTPRTRGCSAGRGRRGDPPRRRACDPRGLPGAPATRYPDGLPAGDAVATTAGDLPATWVIHTVGPVHDPGLDLSATLRVVLFTLARSRRRDRRDERGLPARIGGRLGWPKEDAVRQALDALTTAETTVEEARLVLHGEELYELARRVERGG